MDTCEETRKKKKEKYVSPPFCVINYHVKPLKCSYIDTFWVPHKEGTPMAI